MRDQTLNKEQAKSIEAIIKAEFAPHIKKVDPRFGGFGLVSGWARKRKERVFDEDPLFNTAEAQNNIKALKQAVANKFRNFYYKQRNGVVGPSGRDSAFLKLFVAHPTARQLYEKDVKEELLQETAGQGDEAYQARLTEMWDDLDEEARDEYEQATEKVVSNVDDARQMLLTNFSSALNVVCRSSTLGGMMAITILGYRDTSGEVQLSICDGRVADDNPAFGSDDGEKDILAEFQGTWRKYVDRSLPYTAPPPPLLTPTREVVIPRNGRGVPVFPSIDIMNTLPTTLEPIVIRYFDAVWEYSRDVHHPHALPWEDLVTNASSFYDVDRYDFMCFDRNALRKPRSLYSLAEKLEEQCSMASAAPFTFTPIVDVDVDLDLASSSVKHSDVGCDHRTGGTPSAESVFASGLPSDTEGTASSAPHHSRSTIMRTELTASAAHAAKTRKRLEPHGGSGVDDTRPAKRKQLRRACSRTTQGSDDDESENVTANRGGDGDLCGTAKRRTRPKGAKTASEKGAPKLRTAASGKNPIVSQGYAPAPAADPRRSKRRKVAPTEVQDGVIPGPSEPGVERSTAKGDAEVPGAVKVPKNSIAHGGYIFAKNITKYVIPLEDYLANDGRVMQPHDFGLEEKVKAEVIAERDPAWLAIFWKSCCLARPDDS